MMLEIKSQYSISIIGAGKIAQAVGQLWLNAGHKVCFGVRSPEKIADFLELAGSSASSSSIEKAALEGEIIFLAVPYDAVDGLVPLLTPAIDGKIIIDASNPFSLSQEGRIMSSLAPNLTAGSRMASLFPSGIVIRAFSHVMDELLVSRGTNQKGFWAMALAGDDIAAKRVVEKLIGDTGFIPVDIGTLAESSPLDPGGLLFPHMFTEADMQAVLKRSGE